MYNTVLVTLNLQNGNRIFVFSKYNKPNKKPPWQIRHQGGFRIFVYKAARVEAIC